MPEKFISRNNCINCSSKDVSTLSSGKFGDQPLRDFIENHPSGENPMPYLEECIWEFLKCNQCSQMYHRYICSPQTEHLMFNVWSTKEAIEEFEQKYIKPSAIFQRGRNYVSHILRLNSLLERAEKIKVLDFGCGWGSFLSVCNSFGFETYGIDKSMERRSGGHVEIYPSLDELNKKKFDVVTMFEVLEHVNNPFEILKQLAEVMVQDGVLILETPDCTGVTSIVDYQSYLNIHPLEHINGFTPATLQSIAERAGFRRIRISVAHVTGSRVQILKKEAKGVLQKLMPTTQMYFRKN